MLYVEWDIGRNWKCVDNGIEVTRLPSLFRNRGQLFISTTTPTLIHLVIFRIH